MREDRCQVTRYALGAAVFAAATLANGCGGEAALRSDTMAPRRITAEAVLSEFERTTGETLIAERLNVRGIESSVTLHPSERVERRYGNFRITVLETASAARETPRLRRSEPPDGNGIRWLYSGESELGHPPSWIADKLYDNVLLTWETPVRAVDQRWEMLDEILRRVQANRRA